MVLLCHALPSFAADLPDKPQIIKLERFRKALWTVQVTVKGRTGTFLFDTGGGQTLITDHFATGLEWTFWGRTTGYTTFGERNDSPHCDDVEIKAGNVALTHVSIGKFDFGDRFAGSKTPDGLLSLDAFDGKTITLYAGNANLDDRDTGQPGDADRGT